MKKLNMIFLVILIFFMPIFNTYNQQIAHANVVSKPLTITAKKVAKELAEDSAVRMAEHILFEKQMAEFLNTELVDDGYKAVCLDGPKTYEDCSPDKRGQVKTLTSSDKATLSKKVEEVLERKTNTSSKWGKFLDWFVPVFLISGVVATFESMLDGDSESLLDEIALEALKETGFIKELGVKEGSNGVTVFNFTDYVNNLTLTKSGSNGFNYTLRGDVKQGKRIIMNYNDGGTRKERLYNSGSTFYIELYLYADWTRFEGTSTDWFHPAVYFSSFAYYPTNWVNVSKTYLYEDKSKKETAYNATLWAKRYVTDNVDPILLNNTDQNKMASSFINFINQSSANIELDLETVKEVPKALNLSGQKPVSTIKNSTGSVSVPGIDSFDYTHGENKVYPSPDSTTGWKEKTTGEDIAVVEDDIAVDTEIGAPTEEKEDEEDEFPSCSKSFKKIEFKKVGTAFTNAFPFSIPWDIKRFIDASFGGVGDARPSFALPDYLGGVKLEIPSFFDSWIGFMRTFVIIVFDISLIYLFYRIMRGGGGD